MAEISVGDFYLDCQYHPCLCTSVDGDDIYGISLVDGSVPRGCSIKHCQPRKLSCKQAIRLRMKGPVGRQFANIRRHGEQPSIVKLCGRPWWHRQDICAWKRVNKKR